MIPVTECRTGAEVRALARRVHARPRVPVVRLPTTACDMRPPYTPAERKAACERAIARMWKVPPAVHRIIGVVGEAFNVSRDDIVSSRRTAAIVLPRQIAMYLAKEMAKRSLPEIGRRFGDRDHTTVLHAVRKMRVLVEGDPYFSEMVAGLRDRIERRT